MHSPTLALSRQLWGRHRRGLAAVLLYLAATAVVFNALPAGTLEVRHGALMSIQFVIALIYVAAVFAFGFETQLEVRESGFPARLFTLPVRTSVLVGCPMLQGTAAVALLWVAWARFVLRPSGIEVSLGSTALLAAAFVAVLQALLWCPFGLPWVRVVVALVLLPLLALSSQLGPAFGVSESALLGLYAALLPLAALTAFAGVSRARHGAAPDWRGLFQAPWGVGRGSIRHPAPFASPGRAQLWYERRHNFLGLPLIVGVCSALHLAFVVWMEAQGEKPGLGEGLMFLLFPLLMAPLFGGLLGRTGTSGRNPFLLSSFTATRPLDDAGLVAAKLKVAVLATLAAWAVVLLAASVWFVESGSHAKLRQLWDDLLQAYSTGRVAATVLLAVVGPLLLTWRLLVDNLWVGLTGRPWLGRGSLVAWGVVLSAAGMMYAQVANEPGLDDRLWAALPWWAGAAALLKLLAAVGVGRALLRRGLVGSRTLAKWLTVWLLTAAGLFALACAAFVFDDVPLSLLASGAVLAVPLVRIAAAPLALAWNRHR